MTRAAGSPKPPAHQTLDPAILRIVEAMARAQAQRDFRAAHGLPSPGQ